MDIIHLKLCDIQGRLFEKSGNYYASNDFIQKFMRSEVASHIDAPYNKYQWMGEEYLLEELADEKELKTEGEMFSSEILYWIGYLYRYWAISRGEKSKDIYRQAPAKVMKGNYIMFHTLDPEVAIDDIKEIRKQKMRKTKKPENLANQGEETMLKMQ